MIRRPEEIRKWCERQRTKRQRRERLLFFRGAPSTPPKMAAASAPSSGGGVHFAIPEGTASITQANPATGEGHDSWEEWGVDKGEVTSVTIPTSMTSIGEFAFMDCSSSTSVAIPPSVTHIEHHGLQLVNDRCHSPVCPASKWVLSLDAALQPVLPFLRWTSIEASAFYECSARFNQCCHSFVRDQYREACF